ncbi:MAG: hypothetical protein LBF19_03690 [Prevotellaceae bacterium]|jgi:hypothetical protein|nr:hypothetical protein [Prevotellaceae bacterium]
MTITAFTERLKTLDVGQIAFDILDRHKDELVDVQKSQLWAGRDLKGETLTPKILDDPYFKGNSRWARWWADRKQEQTQRDDNPAFGIRPYGVANLIFSTGRIVWNPIRVFPLGTNDLRIGTEFSIQKELEQKYGDLFGLNPQCVDFVIRTFFREEFLAAVRKHLFES